MSKLATAAVTALALVCAKPVLAADLTVLCSNALKSVFEELTPQFEKASGHKLKIAFGSTGPLKAQIEKGDAFDVAILGVEATEDLIKKGKLTARTDLAKSGMGVAIRKGAPKPDIGTADAFKRTLLAANSIAYSEAGLTGLYLKGLFQRMGIAEDLKSKTRFGRGAEMVGKGEAEIGITQISEILPVAGAELAGPLPSGVQQYTVFPAALSASSKETSAAQALLAFLRSPEAAKVIKAQGLEPAS